MRLEDIEKEYKKVLRLWEDGAYYFKSVQYMLQSTNTNWIRNGAKKTVCAALTLARLGLPITSSSMTFLTKRTRDTVRSSIKHLCTLNVLRGIGVSDLQHKEAIYTQRMYGVHPDFLAAIYQKPIKKEVDNNGNEEE